jgi:salicylate hydroxylase
MAPFLAQGLSLGMEDAATLGALLQHVTSIEQVMDATRMYESLRSDRTLRVVEETATFGQELRLTDGISQVRRDEELKRSSDVTGNW